MNQWLRAARSHRFATDLAVAAALCSATLIAGTAGPGGDGGTVPGTAVLAAVAAYAILLCRRRWPVPTLAATAGAAAVYMTLTSTHGWVVAAPLIALYHLADTTSDRRRLLVTGASAALVLVGPPSLFASTSWLDAENLAVTAACGLALAAGDASRSRRAYVAAVEERAHRAEHTREQEARRRVTEERLRIARDLHDSIGHHIALINAQAGMAAHVFDQQPATARQALTHIRQASRDRADRGGLRPQQPGRLLPPIGHTDRSRGRRIRPPASARRRRDRLPGGPGVTHQRRQARRRRGRAGPAQLRARSAPYPGGGRGERPTGT
jgi:Histidine kinase